MYTGQPVPSTGYATARAKVSDGKSVRVTVPANTTVVAESFALFGGFFGVAKQGVVTAAGQTAEIILDIEQAEFETDAIVVAEAFPLGAVVYWDDVAKKFTVTVGANRKVGRVTSAKDAANVIWFVLAPQAL